MKVLRLWLSEKRSLTKEQTKHIKSGFICKCNRIRPHFSSAAESEPKIHVKLTIRIRGGVINISTYVILELKLDFSLVDSNTVRPMFQSLVYPFYFSLSLSARPRLYDMCMRNIYTGLLLKII